MNTAFLDSHIDLTGYLNKGIPLSMMLYFEWWAFELIILMSSTLGVAQ